MERQRQAFALPVALASHGLRLRPESEADLPFLTRLYASTRETELRHIPWSAGQKQAFLASQFRAQHYYYRTYIPDGHFDILERTGRALGRLYLEAQLTRLHIIDIALLPECRGQGIGTAINVALKAKAAREAKGLVIFIQKRNPALRLYRRLGFEEIADQGVYLEMEWLPHGTAISRSAPDR